METGLFKSFDHAELFYRSWNFNSQQKTIIILHRGHEHSARLNSFATNERFSKYNVFSYDFRGHGYTNQPVSPTFMDYVRDLDVFVHYLHTQYNIKQEDIFVISNSIAGVILSAWVHDYAPTIAGMALLAPAFQIKLYIPFAKQMVDFGTKLNKNLKVTSYVKAKVLTHDKEAQKAYNADPLITKNINGRLLVDIANGGRRIVDDAAAITIPTLIFSAEKDYVVKNSEQKKFYVHLSSSIKEFIQLKGFYHGVLFEEKKYIVYDHLLRFIDKCFALLQPSTTLAEDKFTRDEYDILSLNMLPCGERLAFTFQKYMLNKIGSLSKGMHIGLKYGFDSGIALDYVYKNKPQGKLGIGKIMDKSYLQAIGWRGIRKRKEHLISIITQQINHLQQQGQKIKILDIAGGTGNYLCDIKKQFLETEIVINEFKQSNIEVGEEVIKTNGWKDIRFTNFSCFDLDTYSKLNFHPNIIIISGIFELFGDNELVSQAIQGALSIAEPECTVIYTGQPWHPQLKMIAFVLNSHQGKSWVMRRRSQRELDTIFALQGVEKKNMLIDDYGIFTVSIATKSKN